MSRPTRFRFYSARVRAEMKALDLATRRLPFGAMLISVVALAGTASVISTLASL
jgi:hypothetical protein